MNLNLPDLGGVYREKMQRCERFSELRSVSEDLAVAWLRRGVCGLLNQTLKLSDAPTNLYDVLLRGEFVQLVQYAVRRGVQGMWQVSRWQIVC